MSAAHQHTAIMPSGVAAARAKLTTAKRTYLAAKRTYEAYKSKVEPEVAPDQERPEISRRESHQLASLGVEMAQRGEELFELEEAVADEELKAGLIDQNTCTKRRVEAWSRSSSAGDNLWHHQVKKARFEDAGAVRMVDLYAGEIPQLLLSLYKSCDGQDKSKKRRSNWRRDALAYYNGDSNDHEGVAPGNAWCHITGIWHGAKFHKAAHIVPYFLNGFGEVLFGERAQSLQREGNALLLSDRIKEWFDSYHIVVVPVDSSESPIRRWRTELISPDIRNSELFPGYYGRDLDGKELVFLNENRPVSRFLYFHFIMALIRIKDLQCLGWENVWARFYNLRPFGTPGNYMRRNMLLALATHHGTVGLAEMSAYIAGHGFDTPINLTEEETAEAARRVRKLVEAAINRSEKEGSDEGSEEESDEESNERVEEIGEEEE
ncbi:hypothetical protein TRIATDRAFT_88556 [Trichoderma atroviride IMI 206040]|uniref:HNH nuclease domain-containing protein n=1 Tax=Hypocrea atroviridis (strain ATCC 20476 / IMI 206040) TaxID=452589 RepID=G9NTM6_HYPAI|nr:uncharacterized protein TRIATDRAFT_88556 [Trichoderma atroviride IMI 206040]EHK46066.1 hypothetical protein TRIATDRAFT_88556 [Trichoderma atroviride IMI 206040]